MKGRVKCGSRVGSSEDGWGASAADAVHGAVIVLPLGVTQKALLAQAAELADALRTFGACLSDGAYTALLN